MLVLAVAGCAASREEEIYTSPEVSWAGEFSAWQSARPVTSATAADRLGGATFRIGEAIDLELHPDGEVAYATLPQGAGEAESFGGLASFRIEAAGRYSVGMSAAAWVDVSSDGQPTPAAAFGPGPRGSPVRKFVSFDLTPGNYILEISGSETSDVRVMVVAAL